MVNREHGSMQAQRAALVASVEPPDIEPPITSKKFKE